MLVEMQMVATLTYELFLSNWEVNFTPSRILFNVCISLDLCSPCQALAGQRFTSKVFTFPK